MKSTILRAKNWLSSHRERFPLAFEVKSVTKFIFKQTPDKQNPNSKINMAISIGVEAPDFTLQTKNAEGLKEVVLSGFKGQSSVVLLFFPFAFTGVCTEETCSVRDDLSSYEELDAQVLGNQCRQPVCPRSNGVERGLNFPLVSDFNKNASKAYDVLYEDFIGFEGVSKRSAFVVSKDGIITFAWSSDDPKQLPDFEAIKDALR